MSPFQPGILLPIPAHARYPTFLLWPGKDPRAALRRGRLDPGAIGL